MNFENDDDDRCWNIINGIIDNAGYICEICNETAWFWRESELKLGRCWGDVVECDCDGMFWAVSGASSSGSGLEEGDCDICGSDHTCLTGCGSCNALKSSCCKNWCAETDCVYVIEVLKWSDEDCKGLWLKSMKMHMTTLWFIEVLWCASWILLADINR